MEKKAVSHLQSLSNCLMLSLLFILNNTYASDLIVIEDRGGQDVKTFLKDIIGPDFQYAQSVLEIEQSQLMNGDFSERRLLDKLSPQLPVGERLIERKIRSADFVTVNDFIQQPVAIVGTGELSKRWLSTHKDKLKQLNTFVVIGKASSTDDVEKISNIFGESLPVMSVESLLDQFSVSGIPALITQSGVYQ
ncbi:TPA: DUF2859 domain-containing protein [Vibrio cholerae]